MASRVEKGFVIPDHEHIKAVVQSLQTEIKSNPELAAEWKADPRSVLAARGLPFDVQTELLRETGHEAIAAKSKCFVTCVCTSCCVTVRFTL